MQDPAETIPTGRSDRWPAICPYGHELGSGKILVGWQPCACGPAWAEQGGHRTYWCRVCNEEMGDGRQVICYFPPHIKPRAADSPAPPA